MSDPNNRSTSPRRDKFAALAQQQQQQQGGGGASSATNAETKPAAPKRDKFAAVAAAASSTTPKRDKFAAAAAAAASAPKRDKFGAMAGGSRRDKFSAMASSSTTPTNATTKQEEKEQERVKELQKAVKQRQPVWEDLKKAEGFTIRLLQLASATTRRLAQTDQTEQGDDDDDVPSINDLATKYAQTLTDLHDTLAPHASLVQAYQAPNRANRMYLGRVEQRLATQKQRLLQELTDIEQEASHDDENNTTSAPETETQAETVSTGKRKR